MKYKNKHLSVCELRTNIYVYYNNRNIKLYVYAQC